MNVTILVADRKVEKQIKRLLSFMCGEEVKIASVAQADLLISDRAKPLLEFCDAGKLACQVLYSKAHEPLPESDAVSGVKPLRVFAFDDTPHLHSYPDMRSLAVYVSGLCLSRASDATPKP